MKVLTFRELRKKLTKHDKSFCFYKNKGKGSHKVIEHPDIKGKRVAMPIPAHNDGSDINTNYYKNIARRFNLPKDFFD